jgi:TM2 domain-containing membrane protein YozV
MMRPGRAKRLWFVAAVKAGLYALLISVFVDDMSSLLAFGTLAAVMLAIQALSPFDPTSTGNRVTDDARTGAEENLHNPAPDTKHQHAHQAATHTTERVNAYSAVVTENASPRSRLVALLLAAAPFVFPPICGLQRFYAGKTGTGILWLLTFGFFYIGQIIDIVLIATGTFTDAAGRPIAVWQLGGMRRVSPDSHQAKQAAGSYPHETTPFFPSFLSVVLSLVASLMILAGLMVNFGLAAQLPEAIMAGVMPGFDVEMVRVFGYEDWPSLMHTLGSPLGFGLIVGGGVLLVVARRRMGTAHMLRAITGGGGLVLAATIGTGLMNYNHRVWEDVSLELQANRLGPALELFINRMDQPVGVFALVVLVVSILVLAWPPKQRTLGVGPAVKEGA